VDDRGQRAVGRDRGECLRQGVAVGGVAGGDGDLGAQFREVLA
jgi:hypothetical protein